MGDSPAIRILFLCTGNSARSILAEVVAVDRGEGRIEARSAGSAPKSAPHPLTLETLRARGLATEQLASEHWDLYRNEPFDLIVTLCAAAAAEACPDFRTTGDASPARAHWGFPDPPAAADPEQAFAAVYEGLCEAIDVFLASTDEGIEAAAERAAAHVRRVTGG